MLNAWTGTALAVAVTAAGFHALKLGTAANASTEPPAATMRSAAWGPEADRPIVRTGIATALVDRTRWVLVNRLTDARCTFTRRDRTLKLGEACGEAMRSAHRVRGWRVDERGGKPRVTMVDEMGSQVMEFAWNEETGLASTTGEWRALALVPMTTEAR